MGTLLENSALSAYHSYSMDLTETPRLSLTAHAVEFA